jgi:general secretion pathway protein D
MIEAKILEVTLDNNLQLGIDWEYDSPDTAKKGEPAKVDLKGEFPLDLTDGGIFQIGTLSSDDYQVTLEMLETNSNTEVLSSPRVVVIDNHEASILVGSEEPYITTSTDPDTGWVYEETQFKNVGLQLIVTPKIDEDNYITMTVHPEVSTARRVAEVDNALAIDTTQADTTMMVRDGETIVLGGLMKDTKSNTDKKIPILGDIPILGYLFRSTEQETKKTEILVFITPHILTNENREEISAQEIEDVMERSQTTFDLICEEVDFEQEETTF